MDKVVHFEIPADDEERAKAFYAMTFGWEINSVPQMHYHTVTTVKTDKGRMPIEGGAINGGMMKRTPEIKGPVITISVDNIDDALTKITRSGGQIVTEKTRVGDMGFSAYFKALDRYVLPDFVRRIACLLQI